VMAMLVPAFLVLLRSRSPAEPGPQEVLTTMVLLCLLSGVYLAGAGIQTQSSWRQTRGVHASMIFTLSLPVSRLRLLTVRAALGLLETGAIIAIMISGAWALFPGVRGSSTPADLLRFALTAFVLAAGFYSVSMLLATFLESLWQIYGSMILIVLLWRLEDYLPPSVNIFRVIGADSPLVTHALPWPEMAVSCGLAVVLFLVAARIVQTREY
jgi:hypothetical protein